MCIPERERSVASHACCHLDKGESIHGWMMDLVYYYSILFITIILNIPNLSSQ